MAIELRKSIAHNYFAFSEYAEALDDLDPKLSQEIRPLVDTAQVAAFIAENMHRSPDSVISIVQKAAPALKALLLNEAGRRALDEPLAAQLRWIDPLHLKKFSALIAGALEQADVANTRRLHKQAKTDRIDGLPAIQTRESQAVIANAPNHIDAADQTATAALARAADGSGERSSEPSLDVEVAVEFMAANYRLAPDVIFQNLAMARKELKAIFATRLHLESIEERIAQRLPESGALEIAKFHDVVALALDRDDAAERSVAADIARNADANSIDVDRQPHEVQLDDAAPSSALNEPVPNALGPDADPAHQLALQQMNQIVRFVLPHIRKSDSELIVALSAAPGALKSIFGNQERMDELVARFSEKSSDIDPIDVRRIQTLLVRQGRSTEAPVQSAAADIPEPDHSPDADDQSAPPIRYNANGFRPTEPATSDRPTPISVAGILERITYKTQNDGSVLYSLDGRPAFVDHGNQILMANEADQDEHAIVAALLVAKEKYGGAFELTGDMEFKRRTIEIMIKYKIDAMLKSPEQDALRRELTKSARAEPSPLASPERPISPIDVARIVPPVESAPGAAMPSALPSVESVSKPPPEPVNRLAGKVLQHGEAPFEHDPRENLSYFVELENADGKSKKTWGIDLARAVRAQHLNLGDTVVLQNLGKKPVNVRQNIKNKDGKIIGSEMIVSHRNEWAIEFTKRSAQAEAQDNTAAAAAAKLNEAPVSFVDAGEWWANQHAIIQHFQTDYSDMQTDLGRIGSKPAADQVYWFDAGHPSAPPTDAAQILAVKPQHAQDESGRTVPNLVMHAITTLQDGRSIPSLLLFHGASDHYLQGFIHTGEQKQAVIAHLSNEDAPGTDHTIQLSTMTPTPDGPRWKAIGHGNAVNRSNDGTPVHFDEVDFMIGGSALMARVNKHLDHPLRQRIGFQGPLRERPRDKGAATPVSEKPREPVLDRDKNARIAPSVRKPKRPRSTSSSR